jgi:hypothetical protein
MNELKINELINIAFSKNPDSRKARALNKLSSFLEKDLEYSIKDSKP